MNIEKMNKAIDEAYKIFDENDIRAEVWGHWALPVICAEITGDWKHEHWRARYIMEEAGFRFWQEVSEPSESDWYTATHYYFYPM